ncbi:MAG: DUF211 domain-containing protein [Candidatus Bathyarchaeia archaeon]
MSSVYIKRLLIDALKPRETPIIDLSQTICSVEGIEECDVTVTEVDARTETVKLTIRGPNIDFDRVTKVLEENGMAIRGVDEVSVARTKIPPKPVAK